MADKQRGAGRLCPDCGVAPGQMHAAGCDVAACGACGGQRLSCGCPANEPVLPWSGEWPGEAECREFGWYAVLVPGSGWVPCLPTAAGAVPDLSRLYAEADWDRAQGRFVRPECKVRRRRKARSS